jgi:hypothetical protein
MHWYAAEHATDEGAPEAYMALPKYEQDRIIARILRVWKGEVKLSEASPGDLQVWQGRFRTPPVPPKEISWGSSSTKVTKTLVDDPHHKLEEIEVEEPDWEAPLPTVKVPAGMEDEPEGFIQVPSPPMRRYSGVRERRWQGFWDTLMLSDLLKQPSHRLFGSRNIGNYPLTNLQVGNALACDQTYVVHAWFMSIDLPEDLLRVAATAFHSTVVTIVVGDKPQACLHLDQLLLPQTLGPGLTIPVRQNFAVEFNAFGDSMKNLARRCLLLNIDPFIRIHFEGWQTRDVA